MEDLNQSVFGGGKEYSGRCGVRTNFKMRG